MVFLKHNYNTTSIQGSQAALVMQEWDEDDRTAPNDVAPTSNENLECDEDDEDEVADPFDESLEEVALSEDDDSMNGEE